MCTELSKTDPQCSDIWQPSKPNWRFFRDNSELCLATPWGSACARVLCSAALSSDGSLLSSQAQAVFNADGALAMFHMRSSRPGIRPPSLTLLFPIFDRQGFQTSILIVNLWLGTSTSESHSPLRSCQKQTRNGVIYGSPQTKLAIFKK